MATCFCKQPCEKHTFGSDAWRANQKESWQEFAIKYSLKLANDIRQLDRLIENKNV